MACLAMVVIVAKAEARGGGGGRGGMGGRAFAGGGGGEFRGGDRGLGDAGGLDRGDLGRDLGDGLAGGDRLNGGLDAGRDALGRDGALGGEGTRPLADGAQGERQLQQFLGLPGEGARGVGDRLAGERGALDGDRRGEASERANELRDNAQGWVNRFNHGDEPFTHDWYANHPNAWRWDHPDADAWAAASFAATTAWIGATAFDDGGVNTTTYIDNGSADDDATAESVEPQSTVAANVATDDTSATDGDWLSLGVYALEPPAGGEKELMQLSVSRAGEIKGVYHNADDNLSENVTGTIDRTTQIATWNVVSTPELQFSTSLKTLTSPSGEVSVATPNGGEQTWYTARLQEPQGATSATPSSPEEVIGTP